MDNNMILLITEKLELQYREQGDFTYFNGSGSESVTIKTNYSFAFGVRDISDNNKFVQ